MREQGKTKEYAAMMDRRTITAAGAQATFDRWQDINKGEYKAGLNAMIEENMRDFVGTATRSPVLGTGTYGDTPRLYRNPEPYQKPSFCWLCAALAAAVWVVLTLGLVFGLQALYG
jgi:hypothetical protein